jgi:hypothetical protein
MSDATAADRAQKDAADTFDDRIGFAEAVDYGAGPRGQPF